MDVVTTLLSVVAFLLLAAFIVQPFIVDRRDEFGGTSREADAYLQHAELLAARNDLYRQIAELDFDHSTGKVADEDYRQQRYLLVAQGVDVLQQIDRLPLLDESDDPFERAVMAARRGEAPTQMVAAPQTQVVAGQTNFCPQCGQPTTPADRFCGACGTKL